MKVTKFNEKEHIKDAERNSSYEARDKALSILGIKDVREIYKLYSTNYLDNYCMFNSNDKFYLMEFKSFNECSSFVYELLEDSIEFNNSNKVVIVTFILNENHSAFIRHGVIKNKDIDMNKLIEIKNIYDDIKLVQQLNRTDNVSFIFSNGKIYTDAKLYYQLICLYEEESCNKIAESAKRYEWFGKVSKNIENKCFGELKVQVIDSCGIYKSKIKNLYIEIENKGKEISIINCYIKNLKIETKAGIHIGLHRIKDSKIDNFIIDLREINSKYFPVVMNCIRLEIQKLKVIINKEDHNNIDIKSIDNILKIMEDNKIESIEIVAESI